MTYTPDQQRVADYINKKSGIGGGDDPIGFILAAHAVVVAENSMLRQVVEAAELFLENDKTWGLDGSKLLNDAIDNLELGPLNSRLDASGQDAERPAVGGESHSADTQKCQHLGSQTTYRSGIVECDECGERVENVHDPECELNAGKFGAGCCTCGVGGLLESIEK